MVNSEAFAVGNSTSSASPLIGATLAAWDDDHFIDACVPVVAFDLDVAAIYNELDVWNCNGALCNVCGYDDLPFVGPLEDLVLLLKTQLGVQR